MKVTKTENGIELEAETAHEKDCLEHLIGKQISVNYKDAWNQTGPVVFNFKKHPWDLNKGR